jgi:hypothetical protein
MLSPLPTLSLDFAVIFARQMSAMRTFYGTTLGFPLQRELGAQGAPSVPPEHN